MTTSSLLCIGLTCGIASINPAHAQGASTERRIIINGPDGTREINIDGAGLDDQTVMVVGISGSDGTFSFIGSPSDLPFGGTLGPLGLMAMASGGVSGRFVPIDPGVSYIHQLIKRADVRSDLFLDPKQRDQLEEMETADNKATEQRITQLDRSIKGAQGDASGQNGIADRAKTLHDTIQGSADERDKKLAAILTPKQIKRLKELDLQYRGPLAMGVKRVADKAQLTEKQAPAVADLLKEYRESVRKALGIEQNETRSTGPDGSSVSVSSSISASSDELKARLEKAHDDIEQARRALGEKALKSVTDTQRSEWKNLTGSKFQFQTLN
jgi:hypothetical protein